MAPQADVVILTALDLESLPFRTLLDHVQHFESGHRQYFRGRVDRHEVVVWTVLGAGNVGAAIAAQQAITLWNPEYILLSGITGGFESKELALGDVLVPDQVIGYEHGKVRDAKIEQRFEVHRPSDFVISAAHEARKTDWTRNIRETAPVAIGRPPRVHFGSLASGEKVVTSKQWGDAFRETWPRLTGVEMEGIGVLQAAYRSDQAPKAGVIKGISDWADRNKGDDWQPFAASAAAAFVVAVIRAATYQVERPQPQRVGSSLSSHASPELKRGWGSKKVQMCRRLSHAEQRELADCLEIDPHVKDRFDPVTYCSSVWDFLQRTEKLSELPGVLKDCLGREDLASLIEDVC